MHAFQVPRQTSQVPFTFDRLQSADKVLSEPHHFLDNPEYRLPHWNFRGMLSVHCMLRPACSLNPLRTLLHQKLQLLRYLHNCSDCYRPERQLPGGSLTH